VPSLLPADAVRGSEARQKGSRVPPYAHRMTHTHFHLKP
jgi:hypothetical protein